MASGKQSPRQKMINMMYLVLTALLAMNVSKSILDSFIAIDEGQIKTRLSLSDKLDGQMNTFQKRANSNPGKFKANFDKANRVQETANALITHINLIKAKTIAISEGKTIEDVYDSKADTVLNIRFVEKKDDYDSNTRIMYGLLPEGPDPAMDDNANGENPEGYNYRAAELKKRLIEFRDMIISDFGDGNPTLVASVNKMFSFDGITDVEGKETTWENLNFYHVPLAASTSLLSKIQSDVLSAESDAVKAIFDEVEGKDYKFNKLSDAVIPEATYVTQGGKFRADVFLAAFDDKNSPTILLGDPGVKYDSIAGKLTGGSTQLEMDGPKGIVEIQASGLGPQHREGVIIFEPSGLPKVTRSFALDYTVAAPTLVVSPTKMNVVYRGLQNPIAVSAAGFKSSDLSITVSNADKSGGTGGEYKISPKSGKECVVSCTAKLPDGSSKSLGSVNFRVKNVPDPVASFNGKTPSDNRITKAEVLSASGLRANLKDFEFAGVKYSVTQFKISMNIKGQIIDKVANGARLTADMKQMLKGVRSGQRVVIENIRAKGPDGSTRKLGSISLKVI